MVDRVRLCAEAAWGCTGGAAVRGPHGLAIPVNSDAVGTAPRPILCTDTGPIPDDAIGVGAAVHGLHFVGLNGAAPLLRQNAGCLHGDANDNQRRWEPESRNTR